MIKSLPINELVEYDLNPRINDGQAVDAILHSLRKHGQVAPLIVNEIGFPFGQHVICCGNTRFKALKQFGAQEVTVYVHRFKDEQEFASYNIVDNKSSEFSQWNEGELVNLASQFDIDLDEIGFDLDGILDGPMIEESEPKEKEPKEPTKCPACGYLVD